MKSNVMWNSQVMIIAELKQYKCFVIIVNCELCSCTFDFIPVLIFNVYGTKDSNKQSFNVIIYVK